MMIVGCIVAFSACDSLPGTTNEELVGEIKFVLVERAATIPYLVQGGEAILLMPSDDVSFVGIGTTIAGDGISFWDHRFHSAGTYRMTGSFSEEISRQYKIVTMPTRQFNVESFELLENGATDCTAYLAVSVPPTADRSGFVPVLPESVADKEGIFVQNGTVSCTIVAVETPGGQRLTMSFRSNGSIDINEAIPWARADIAEGEGEKEDAPIGKWSEQRSESSTSMSDERKAALQREALDLGKQIEATEHEIQAFEEHLKSSSSDEIQFKMAQEALLAAKQSELSVLRARKELVEARGE